MSNESGNAFEGNARVRHVPIQIESRTKSRNTHSAHHDRDQPQQGCNRSNEGNRGNYNSQTLPNTSSINIDYKPSTDSRRQPSPNFSANNNYYNSQSTNPEQRQQQQQHQQKFSSANTRSSQDYKSSPATSASSRQQDFSDRSTTPQNSDKLVNSPEPIPLPPPPPEQQHNQSSRSARDETASPENKPQHQQTTQVNSPSAGHEERKADKNMSPANYMNSIKMNVSGLLQKVAEFGGVSASSKEYRYLDEMLTRSLLNLDQIDCSQSSQLRDQRRAIIKLTDKASDILQRKVQLNSDIKDLSELINSSH